MSTTQPNVSQRAIAVTAEAPEDALRSGSRAIAQIWQLPARLVMLLEQFGFVGRSALSIVDQAVVSGTSFITAVIVGRTTAPAELGQYYLVLTVLMVLVGLQEAMVAAPYMVLGAKRRGRDLAEFTGSMWVQHFVLTLVGTAAAVLIAWSISRTSVQGLSSGLWLLVAVGPIILFREGIRRLAFARLRVRTALAIDIGVCLMQLSALAALSYFGWMSVPLVFAVMGGASLVACICWLLSGPGRPLVVRNRLYTDWMQCWAFSRWTMLSFFAVDTIPYMMPWIIGFAAGEAATGIFGGCATLLGVTNILVHGVGNFMRPHAAHAFAAGGVHALRRVLLVTGSVFVAVFGVLSLLFLMTGDWLAVFVFGTEFEGTAQLLLLLSLNVLVGSTGFVAGSGLWAIGQPRAGLIADVCMLAVTLTLASLLVGPYGPVGAAISAVIGTTAGTALKILTVIRAMRLYGSHDATSGATETAGPLPTN
jgi:O-antigen/teichoic acid export membrane protein